MHVKKYRKKNIFYNIHFSLPLQLQLTVTEDKRSFAHDR